MNSKPTFASCRTALWIAAVALGLQAPPAIAAVQGGGMSTAPPPTAEILATSPFSETFSARGTGAMTFDFQASASGAFTVRLADLGFLSRFDALAVTMTSDRRTELTINGQGEGAFAAGAAGLYSAIVSYRTRDATLPALFSLQVLFEPNGTPVPLPGGFWLLLTATAALAGVAGRRRGGALRLSIPAGFDARWAVS
jgi:hypothetical protein